VATSLLRRRIVEYFEHDTTTGAARDAAAPLPPRYATPFSAMVCGDAATVLAALVPDWFTADRIGPSPEHVVRRRSGEPRHDGLLCVQAVLGLSNTTERGPSITASVISSPRCAGRQ
jgi:hypothetical protein